MNLTTAAFEALWLIALATIVALVLGVVLGVALGLPIDRRHRALRIARVAGPEALVSLLEAVPVMLIFLFAASGLRFVLNQHRVVLFGIIGGLLWSRLVARTVEVHLREATQRDAWRQLAQWRVHPLQIGLRFVLRHRVREVLGSGALVATYALLTDTSAGYIIGSLRSGDTVYAGTIGYWLAAEHRELSELAMGGGMVFAFTVGLLWLSDLLDRRVAPPVDEIVREASTTVPLRVPSVHVSVGSTAGESAFLLTVVPSADFRVKRGQVAWLWGASGSGKSLFSAALIGLPPPGSRCTGRIEYAPGRTDGLHAEVVFQEPALYLYPFVAIDALAQLATGQRWATLYDTMASGAQPDAVNNRRRQLGRRTINECSAGEKRIVFTYLLFARLAGRVEDTPLLVCDEPDASLDEANREVLADHLANVLRRPNAPGLLYIGHRPSLLNSLRARLPDRQPQGFTFVPHPDPPGKGRIMSLIRENPPEEVLHQPDQLNELPVPHDALLEVHDMTVTLPGGRTLRYARARPFAIGRGDVVVLTGGNGAGKSTFLKGLAGVFQGHATSFRVGQTQHIDRQSMDRRSHLISYLFEDAEKSLPLESPVGETIRAVCRAWSAPEDAVSTIIRHAGFDQIFDVDYEARRPMELSGGQRQLLTFLLARAITRSPVVLLDEPFSRLDAHTEALACRYLYDDRDRAYLIVTHRPQQLLSRGGAFTIDIEALRR